MCVYVCVSFTLCLHVSEVNVDRPVCLPSGLFLHLHPLYLFTAALLLFPPLFRFHFSSLYFGLICVMLCSPLCSQFCLYNSFHSLISSLFHSLPDPFFFLSFFLLFFFLPSLNLTPSHALSISCGLSGLQSCVMGDRRGRLRSVTLICRG